MHPLSLSRRRLLGAAAVGAVLTLCPSIPAAAGSRGVRPAFQLPAPTGPHPIGTVPLHLIDPSRTDPWVTPARPRELMVQLWYPTAHPAGPPAPWLTPAEAGPIGRDLAETVSGVQRDLCGLAEVRTHAHTGAPVASRRGGWPVVLFSPGFGAERNSSAALVEDLASRGHVAVTVDHTHDPLAVEFPSGRVEPNTMPGARHLSFHDSVLMMLALAALPGAQTTDAYGTIDGRRVAAVARAHVGAFFDLHLRGVGSTLLDAASPRYPEIRFVA